MAFKASYEINCSCGNRFEADLCEYIFTAYDSDLKDALLTGDFNWLSCPSCKEHFPVETRFLYRDEENMLWVWVCKRGEENRADELYEELMNKNIHFKDHFLDDKANYRKFLVFGRDALIELLLKEDKELKKTEGRSLKKNNAQRLILEEYEEPGLFLLNGEKVKIAIPLKLPNKNQHQLQDLEARKRWLKYYSQGLNIHNPYSSFLNSRLKAKWDKSRQKEPLNGFKDEFEDFAHSWASNKTDPKAFKKLCPERRQFFDKLKEIAIPRKLYSINPRSLRTE
jgi:hypothetical protein